MSRRQQVGEQVCQRRHEGKSFLPPPDHWETGRWPTTAEEQAADEAEGRAHAAKNGYEYRGPGFLWPTDLAPAPRCCSYCGGLHPEDFFALLEKGFLVEPTDKGYKGYVLLPDGKSPTPPAKLYTQHLDTDQIARLNEWHKANYPRVREMQDRRLEEVLSRRGSS